MIYLRKMNKMKICSRCNQDKSLEDFHKAKKNVDGHAVWCKSCMKEYARLNEKSIKLSKKKYNEKKLALTAEERRIKKEKKRLEAPLKRELSLAKKREYARIKKLENPNAKRLSDKKYREKSKVSRNEKDKQRKARDPQYKLIVSMRVRLNKAIKNNQKAGSAIKDLGCSVEHFKKYIESMFYNHITFDIPMIWENYGKGYGKWNLDHIRPLHVFDLTNREELLKACHYTNLQPLWTEDHIVKTTSDIKKAS